MTTFKTQFFLSLVSHLRLTHNFVHLCAHVLVYVLNVSAYRNWCCRLWSHPDFHPGPSGDRSPACRTTWSLCPSAVVLHTDTDKDTRREAVEKKSQIILHATLHLSANLAGFVTFISLNRMIFYWLICRFDPRNLTLVALLDTVWQLKTIWPHAASWGISYGEASQAHPIRYRILRLILPSLSLFHLNKAVKLFLNLWWWSAASPWLWLCCILFTIY